MCERERERGRGRETETETERGGRETERRREGGRERETASPTHPKTEPRRLHSLHPMRPLYSLASPTHNASETAPHRIHSLPHGASPGGRHGRGRGHSAAPPPPGPRPPRLTPGPARPDRPDSTRQEGGRALGPPLRLAPSLAESFLAQILWAAKGLGAGSAGPGPGPARMGVLSSIPSRLGPGSGPVLQVRVPAACGVRGAGGVSAYSPPPLLDQLGPPARHPSLVSNFSDLRVRLWRDDMRT